jgi:hypothetical protein
MREALKSFAGAFRLILPLPLFAEGGAWRAARLKILALGIYASDRAKNFKKRGLSCRREDASI